jgi:hypothetical protein
VTDQHRCKSRALVMPFLFSDVSARDAPTRIRVGSHVDIAQQLAPAGEADLALRELVVDGFAGSAHRLVTTAAGDAGTVDLYHPFLVHVAQPHRGTRPRFLAQPPLLPAESGQSPAQEPQPGRTRDARSRLTERIAT